MFSYIMLGTNDLPRAIRFYDPLMEMLGQPRAAAASKAHRGGHSAETAPSGCALANRSTSSRQQRATALWWP